MREPLGGRTTIAVRAIERRREQEVQLDARHQPTDRHRSQTACAVAEQVDSKKSLPIGRSVSTLAGWLFLGQAKSMDTDVELDVVLEYGVAIKVAPSGIILLLRHASVPDAMKGAPGRQTSLYLTKEQAQSLSEGLARKLWQSRQSEKPGPSDA